MRKPQHQFDYEQHGKSVLGASKEQFQGIAGAAEACLRLEAHHNTVGSNDEAKKCIKTIVANELLQA